jgi:hypothetical protein
MSNILNTKAAIIRGNLLLITSMGWVCFAQAEPVGVAIDSHVLAQNILVAPPVLHSLHFGMTNAADDQRGSIDETFHRAGQQLVHTDAIFSASAGVKGATGATGVMGISGAQPKPSVVETDGHMRAQFLLAHPTQY